MNTAKLHNIQFHKTYATPENAIKAVEKLLPKLHDLNTQLRYFLHPVVENNKIRYGVVFIGESSMQAGVHFHFNIIG